MKILLIAINAKYIHSNLAVYSLRACAQKYCAEQNLDAEISLLEFSINQYIDDIFPQIYKQKADVAAFSCYIWNLTLVEELCALLRQAAPNVAVWLGGPEVSYDAEDVLLRDPSVKLVMCGEGEDTFTELAAACARTKTADLPDTVLQNIRGIVFRTGTSSVSSERVPNPVPAADPYPDTHLYSDMIPNLGTVPNPNTVRTFSHTASGGSTPAISADPVRPVCGTVSIGSGAFADAGTASIGSDACTDAGTVSIGSGTFADAGTASIGSSACANAGTIHIYRTPARPPVCMDQIPFVYQDMQEFEHKIIYYESSRGCPFSCSYCLSSIDHHLRFRSLPLVLRELQFFLDHKVPQVKFVDRTFNCRPDRTLKIWQYLLDHDNGMTNFHFEITAELLDAAQLDLLRRMRPGLVQLEIGVQSTNPQTISEIDRHMNFENLSRIVQSISAGHNVHQHLDLIAGLPFEDLESFRNSFNDVYALKPQQLQMGFLKVLKGSKMHRVSRSYDLIYHAKPVYEVLSTRWMTYDEILLLKGVEEMTEVYYNSCQFYYSLLYLEHFFEAPFDLFLALAKYYDRHGLWGKNYGRLQRYTILRDFTCETFRGHAFSDDTSQDHAASVAPSRNHAASVEISQSRAASDEPSRNHAASVEISQNHAASGFSPALFDEILVYDLYLRENLKSRPVWAKDPHEYKDAIAAFYASAQSRALYFPEDTQSTMRQIRHRSHIEVFRYDIVQSAATGRKIPPDGRTLLPDDQEVPPAIFGILFDYEKRDPLTANARTFPISLR